MPSVRRTAKKIQPTHQLERQRHSQGYQTIVGLDEVGRGAWAGPLVFGAVILHDSSQVPGLRDSKLLSPTQREQLVPIIYREAVSWGLGIVEIDELNQIGLAEALRVAAARAIASLSVTPDLVLFDGKHRVTSITIQQETIIKGDQTVASIAAASVIAKVARDQMMRDLHAANPTVHQYNFYQNKGYPSPAHRQALALHGSSVHHRTCFQPIRELKFAQLTLDFGVNLR